MFRMYENPYKIHKMLTSAEAEYEAALVEEPDNIELLIELSNEVESLRQRESFAWEDEEYDEDYC